MAVSCTGKEQEKVTKIVENNGHGFWGSLYVSSLIYSLHLGPFSPDTCQFIRMFVCRSLRVPVYQLEWNTDLLFRAEGCDMDM